MAWRRIFAQALSLNGLLRPRNSAFAFTKLRITGKLKMFWARLLAFMSPEQNQELLLRNGYLATENRILGGQSAWLYVPRVLVS